MGGRTKKERRAGRRSCLHLILCRRSELWHPSLARIGALEGAELATTCQERSLLGVSRPTRHAPKVCPRLNRTHAGHSPGPGVSQIRQTFRSWQFHRSNPSHQYSGVDTRTPRYYDLRPHTRAAPRHMLQEPRPCLFRAQTIQYALKGLGTNLTSTLRKGVEFLEGV